MDLHNGLDIEVYDLRPTDLHYYYYFIGYVLKICFLIKFRFTVIVTMVDCFDI